MLLTKTVMLKAPPKLFKYYKDRGYDIKYGECFECNIDDLSLGSHVKVDVKCDYCGEIVPKQYKGYINEHKKHDKDACSGCRYNNTQKTLNERYGVNHLMELDEVKEKIRKTCIDRYGVDSVSKVPKIRDKANATNMERYGSYSYMKTKEGKLKSKSAMIEKYGVWYTGTDEYKKKARQTNLNRYGCVHPTQNKVVQDKIKNTCLARYGVKNVSHSDFFIDKIRTAHNEKYGCYYSKTDEFKTIVQQTWRSKSEDEINQINNRREKTMIEKYGVPYCMRLDEYVINWLSLNKTNNKNSNGMCKYRINGQPCSEQQKYIYEMISRNFEMTDINYNELRYSIDVVLFKNDVKIAIEYDGWYWHKDKKDKDNEKTNNLIKNGWKVFRIKSDGRLLTDAEILDVIDTLLYSSKQYIEILTGDWIKREGVTV